MAFEDAYGETLSTSPVKGYFDQVDDSYLATLAALLPPGPLWTVEEGTEKAGLLEALSYALLRVEQRGIDLFEEVDPRTTVELIDDWERVLNLPADNPNPPTTLADRRAAIHSLLLGHGDPTEAFFEDVATGLGYDVTVTDLEFDPFTPGSVAGDPLTQSEWAFIWSVACLGDDDNDVTLKWTLGKLVPAHTRLWFKIAAETWDTRTSNMGANWVLKIGYGRGLFVAVGTAGAISTSPDGETWTSQTSGFGSDIIYGVIEGGGLLLAHGDAGKLTTSTDGSTWTARTSQFGTDIIYGMIYAENLYLAVGDNGKISTSTDGLTWTARTNDGSYAGAFQTAIYGRSLYIIGGTSGEIQTSPDGTTWTARTSNMGANQVNGFTYGDGTLVAVGHGGQISSSTNGTTWTARTSQFSTTDIIFGVAYGNGVFVAVGDTGKLSSSPDGETWTSQTSQFGTSKILRIVYGNGLFVAVGDDGKVSVSTDGETWTARTSGFSTTDIYAVGYGAYTFAIGGPSGLISTTHYGEL